MEEDEGEDEGLGVDDDGIDGVSDGDRDSDTGYGVQYYFSLLDQVRHQGWTRPLMHGAVRLQGPVFLSGIHH